MMAERTNPLHAEAPPALACACGGELRLVVESERVYDSTGAERDHMEASETFTECSLCDAWTREAFAPDASDTLRDELSRRMMLLTSTGGGA